MCLSFDHLAYWMYNKDLLSNILIFFYQKSHKFCITGHPSMTNDSHHQVPVRTKRFWCECERMVYKPDWSQKIWKSFVILGDAAWPFQASLYCTGTVDPCLSGWCNRVWHPIYRHPLLWEADNMMTTQIQSIPRNMHTVLLCFALLWLCNRS